MGTLRYGRGPVSVEISDDLDRMIRRGLEETRPGVMAHLEEAAGDVGSGARLRWPEKTGRSKKAMRWGVRLRDATTIESYVENDAKNDGYAYPHMVRTKRTGKNAWNLMVRDPMKRRGDRMVEELGSAVSETIQTGR